eukprot:3382958-Alexandrium_andersonii.AAC.1
MAPCCSARDASPRLAAAEELIDLPVLAQATGRSVLLERGHAVDELLGGPIDLVVDVARTHDSPTCKVSDTTRNTAC